MSESVARSLSRSRLPEAGGRGHGRAGVEQTAATPDPAPTAPPDRRAARRLAAVIALVGLVITVLCAWAAARVDHNAERRLLQGQTKQAAAVLSSAIVGIQAPLGTALSVQRAVRPSDDPRAFDDLMAAYVGPDKLFVSAALWQRRGSDLVRLTSVGLPAAMDPAASATRTYLGKAFDVATVTVRSVTVGSGSRIAYARADTSTDLVVYAERAVPANRRAPVDRDSAFADLHYAIYLGPEVRQAALSTTDVAPASLPLGGNTDRVQVPFGDTVLTLVTTPRHHLGATLSRWLSLLLLVGGLVLTAVAARTGYHLVAGRQDAQQDAATIAGLYQQVGTLYEEQREPYERLQRALLPHVIPTLPHLEIASEYVAGARGVDIGGDWYSIIALAGDTFGFVVGDVSGRGVDAVAVMAHVRFTLRAYLIEGHSPSAALEMCSHQFDITTDGHMTTALVGVGDHRTGEVTLANAGHPRPLLVADGAARFLDTRVGPPLGTGPAPYPSTTVTLPPGALLFCYTDGLVERRTEDIDTGMDRLRTTVEQAHQQGTPVQDLVEHTLGALRNDTAPDDIAVLAFRWGGVA